MFSRTAASRRAFSRLLSLINDHRTIIARQSGSLHFIVSDCRKWDSEKDRGCRKLCCVTSQRTQTDPNGSQRSITVSRLQHRVYLAIPLYRTVNAEPRILRYKKRCIMDKSERVYINYRLSLSLTFAYIQSYMRGCRKCLGKSVSTTAQFSRSNN